MKVLSLPLSVAVATVLKTQASGATGLLVGLLPFVVSLANTFLIRHYQRVIPRMEQNIEMVFGRLTSMDSARSNEVDNNVVRVKGSLLRETSKLRATLRTYFGLAWGLPVVGAVMMFCESG